MKLSNLYNWYCAIKNNKLTYNVYDCHYNHVSLSLLFDIGQTPFILSIIKRESAEVISFPITQGFKIETSLSADKYNLLRKILNIPKGKNSPFSTNTFFSELNSIFPFKISESGKLDNNILNKIYNFEESDKCEFDRLIDWNNSNSGRHHTYKNHEKTRILYPDIYDKIKGKDISVRYK